MTRHAFEPGSYTGLQQRQREFESQWRAGHIARHRDSGKLYEIRDTDEIGIMVMPLNGLSWAAWIGWAELRLKYEFVEVHQ